MSYTSSVESDELAALRARWADAVLASATLAVDSPFLTGKHQLLTSARRRAEICYVMHRGDPADGVLLHIKTFYPEGAYRLPTGGIHVGEPVLDTLTREIFEETGLTVGAGANQVQVEQFLGVLSYELRHATLGATSFATYHFLVRIPPDAVLTPQDPDESIGGWQWRPARELCIVAETLENVYLQAPEWADWGRFRALSHRFVAERLDGGARGELRGSNRQPDDLYTIV